jgi:hypothetical protein
MKVDHLSPAKWYELRRIVREMAGVRGTRTISFADVTSLFQWDSEYADAVNVFLVGIGLLRQAGPSAWHHAHCGCLKAPTFRSVQLTERGRKWISGDKEHYRAAAAAVRQQVESRVCLENGRDAKEAVRLGALERWVNRLTHGQFVRMLSCGQAPSPQTGMTWLAGIVLAGVIFYAPYLGWPEPIVLLAGAVPIVLAGLYGVRTLVDLPVWRCAGRLRTWLNPLPTVLRLLILPFSSIITVLGALNAFGHFEKACWEALLVVIPAAVVLTSLALFPRLQGYGRPPRVHVMCAGVVTGVVVGPVTLHEPGSLVTHIAIIGILVFVAMGVWLFGGDLILSS